MLDGPISRMYPWLGRQQQSGSLTATTSLSKGTLFEGSSLEGSERVSRLRGDWPQSESRAKGHRVAGPRDAEESGIRHAARRNRTERIRILASNRSPRSCGFVRDFGGSCILPQVSSCTPRNRPVESCAVARASPVSVLLPQFEGTPFVRVCDACSADNPG